MEERDDTDHLSDLRVSDIPDFPDYFIRAGIEASLMSGAIISFRAGQPPHLRKGRRVSPKPRSLHLQTCTEKQGIPMVAGLIPIDQRLFGRTGVAEAQYDGLEWVRKDLMAQHQQEEADRFSRVPLEVTFEEIHTGSLQGQYILSRVSRGKNDWEFSVPGIHDNEFVEVGVDRHRLRFRIRKNDMQSPDEFLRVEYLPPGSLEFVLLYLIAYEGYPVTGDVDMLAVATPLQAMTVLSEELLQGFPASDLYRAYDVSDFEQLKELVILYLMLRHAMNGKPVSRKEIGEQEIRIIMQSAAVRSSGIITPCELLILMLCHDKLSQSYEKISPGSENLIRHGAETCNPGKLSDLNTRIVHLWQGKIFVTHDQAGLVAFYLQAGLLEKNFLYVNPRWNMTLWSPVIERQLALGQGKLINEATLHHYREWQAGHEPDPGRNTTEILSEMHGHEHKQGVVAMSPASPDSPTVPDSSLATTPVTPDGEEKKDMTLPDPRSHGPHQH